MTSPSPLERLAGPGNVLAKELPDAKEFAGLVASGLARLSDAENERNLLYSRFDLAYGAARDSTDIAFWIQPTNLEAERIAVMLLSPLHVLNQELRRGMGNCFTTVSSRLAPASRGD